MTLARDSLCVLRADEIRSTLWRCGGRCVTGSVGPLLARLVSHRAAFSHADTAKPLLCLRFCVLTSLGTNWHEERENRLYGYRNNVFLRLRGTGWRPDRSTYLPWADLPAQRLLLLRDTAVVASTGRAAAADTIQLYSDREREKERGRGDAIGGGGGWYRSRKRSLITRSFPSVCHHKKSPERVSMLS
uniref:Uncharacterized protein n=1 Tax=Trichuris muris TaxID=70415 RepID=A0A5S6Q7L2_TRIMR